MKRFLLVSVGFGALLVAGFASAADMPVKAPPLEPAYSWAGCYIGVNGGWINGRDRTELAPAGTYLTPAGVPSPPNAAGGGLLPGDITLVSHSYRDHDGGASIGVTSGCNWQNQRMVFGYEGDTNWSSLRVKVNAAYPAFTSVNAGFTGSAHTEQVTNKLDWFSTYRLRAGYLLNDRTLLYITGGLAAGHFRSDTSVVFGAAPGPGLPLLAGATHLGSESRWRLGAVVGGGAEWAFGNGWTAKAEYLYMTFQHFSYASPLTAPAGVAAGYAWNTNVRPQEHLFRVGLNRKFDLFALLRQR